VSNVTTTLHLYNSWSRTLEPFEPLEAGRVSLYACGPTVYDYAHIGNFRFNVWVDVLRRVLEWNGYQVTLVMNITDVDDKTIAGAQKAGESLQAYTSRFTEAFFSDLRTLGIEPASHYPRATEHIEDMVALVEALMQRGLAYEQDGSVYFRVSAFPEYGRLSDLDPEQLRSTGRVEGDAYDKEDVRDFALWKGAKEGEPSWDTRIGKGRPGWHLECSAMSMKYLGNTFDIHVGGVDLKFPHHENEIAQSVGATGEPFARYWLHCAHLIVDGTKMSKSLGNQYTLRELLDEGHDPVAIRYLLASVNYRKQLNFTFEALAQAKAAVTRLREAVLRLEAADAELPQAAGSGAARAALAEADEGFTAALADDLNTSGALGHMFTLVKAAHTLLDDGAIARDEAAAMLAWLRDVDRIWGVLPTEGLVEREVEVDGRRLVAVGPPMADDDIDLVLERMKARAGRDFAAADALRERLRTKGVTVEDTAKGARWHLQEPAAD
jgi:cysteinyl-tRNA synthetase